MQALDMELVKRLRKDLKKASERLAHNEARALVDMYYTVQKSRIAMGNKIGAINRLNTAAGVEEEPSMLLSWFKDQYYELENNIKRALDIYSRHDEVCVWMRQVIGVGPVLAAGLRGNLDIGHAKTAGAFWRFAGLDPSVRWDRNQKRPWNASLKVVCWKLGESFIKVSGNEKSLYGRVYRERRALEEEKNARGEYADQAAAILKNKNFRKGTQTRAWYEKGMLPPAHIMQRAARYAVKLFLSHLFEYWYELEYGMEAPKPYCFAHLGHVHKIEPEVKKVGA